MELGFRLYFADKTVTVMLSELTGETNGNTTTYKTAVEGINIAWNFEALSKGTVITLSAESDKPLALERIDTLYFAVDNLKKTDRLPFYINSWTRSESRYPSEFAENEERYADCTGLFGDFTARGFALAMVSPYANIVGACAKKCGSTFEFSAKTELTDGMKAKNTFSSDRALFIEDVTVDELYDIYRGMLPQSSFPMPKLIGWNSWDYYLDRVKPEDIFENIEALSKMSFADKLDYIVVDDGWQKEWGVWTENEKFACGLDYVAKRIAEAGFMPGIWMAPILMKDSCEGFEQRTEWLMKKDDGEYAREIYGTYVLDPTHPDAKAFILNNYKYLYSCGYRLFKIDYLSCLLTLKKFYDKAATPYTALAQLIEEIKACTGPDAVILGCSLPIQCGADIAPSMRIGIDIHNHFGHVRWIAESLSWTWQYNNVVTRIDPDFLVVRGSETSNEPLIWEPEPKYVAVKRRREMTNGEYFATRWRNGDQFDAVEAETWANLVAISGGNIFLSDRMSVLNEKGISILENAFAAAAEECRPCYLPDDKRLPSVWKSAKTLLIINWEDEPMLKTINCNAAKLNSDKEFTLADGKLTVPLLAHESFLAFVE